jgi:hypothetical protein
LELTTWECQSAQFVFVAILFVPSAPAIPPPSKELTVSADLESARQRGPLQIVGFKMPEEMGDSPVIVLRNVSAKATRSFWFTVRIGCANPSNQLESGPPVAELGPWKNPQDPRWPKESTIAPGALGDAHITGLNGHHWFFLGGLHGAVACER